MAISMCGAKALATPRPDHMSIYDNPPIHFDAALNRWTETHGCEFRQIVQVRLSEVLTTPSGNSERAVV